MSQLMSEPKLICNSSGTKGSSLLFSQWTLLAAILDRFCALLLSSVIDDHIMKTPSADSKSPTSRNRAKEKYTKGKASGHLKLSPLLPVNDMKSLEAAYALLNQIPSLPI